MIGSRHDPGMTLARELRGSHRRPSTTDHGHRSMHGAHAGAVMTQRRTNALILGKFLPPHRGHRFLAEAARDEADDVIIALLANSAEPIPVDLRHAWLAELFPW